MAVQTAERRQSTRVAAAYQAVLRTRRGKLLARGRTADISENGVFVVGRFPRGTPTVGEAVIELQIPDAATARGKRRPDRTVRFRCRIVRTAPMGDLLGVGIEFLEKLA